MSFLFKQKTADEMRIRDWSSDVCSSDLLAGAAAGHRGRTAAAHREHRRGAAVPQRRIAVRVGEDKAFGQEAVALDLAAGRIRLGLDVALGAEAHLAAGANGGGQTEERAVGKEGVSACMYRWGPDTLKKKQTQEVQ